MYNPSKHSYSFLTNNLIHSQHFLYVPNKCFYAALNIPIKSSYALDANRTGSGGGRVGGGWPL